MKGISEMETLMVTVEYGSEPMMGGFIHLYTFRKTFGLKKLPCIPSYIYLDDAQRRAYFKDPEYYPRNDTYHLKIRSTEGLKRYNYSEDSVVYVSEARAEIYKYHGWEVEKIEAPRF